ncbi:MAG: hypothetical protein JWM80_2036 [Cyanobacteria bacterium RYN_339]|nr:hypothetical protein [Cyanobacteria bacterium RYN_339]
MRALVAAAALLLAGCFDQGQEFQQLAPPSLPPGAVAVLAGPPDDVFPLQAGARYDYAAKFGLGGNGPFTGAAAFSVVGAWRVGERTIARVGVQSTYFGRTRRDIYVFTREAGWIGLFEKDPPDKVTLFMPTRLEGHGPWDVATGEGTGRAEVEATEAVTVPAGTFAGCKRIRYRNEGVQTTMTLWMAPRVGLVQADVAMQIGPVPLNGRLQLAHVVRPH